MGENSKIEWCDHTFNPWIGCTKVSAGCANCYAEGESKRRGWAQWGKGKPRHRTSENYWKQPLKWNAEAAKAGTRPRVFCASLADWLDDEVPVEWLADLLALIRRTPHLDWLLLTKRPENWRIRLAIILDWIDAESDHLRDKEWVTASPGRSPFTANDWLAGDAPTNVWLGVSVENQAAADERIPRLLTIPAAVRFLSCEPLLGPVSLMGKSETNAYEFDATGLAWSDSNTRYERLKPAGIHWVICGGESGPGARPMNPAWARSLRDQSVAADISFFFKQWGEWVPLGFGPERDRPVKLGKKAAGRLLDGEIWSQFP